MAGYSALVCIFLCAFAHAFPLPDEREASVLSEVTVSKHLEDDNEDALVRATYLVILSLVVFGIALGIFMIGVYFFLRLLEKQKSPENNAEAGEAKAGETLCRCGKHSQNLKCTCLRCASPSKNTIELSISCHGEDESPCGRLSPLSTPASPDTEEYYTCPSLDSATAEEEASTNAGASGGNGPGTSQP